MSERRDFKTWTTSNVWDSAHKRVEWLMGNFEHVMVNCSGGKDSTCVVNVALNVAEKLDRLPLPVMFLDQEAEWDCTIEYVRELFSDPRIEPHWLQVPFRIFNASSVYQPWLNAWEEGGEWLRPKEPDSIHANQFGTDRFTKLLDHYVGWLWNREPACSLTGVRVQESPGRRLGLTVGETYKGETWGSKGPVKDQLIMHPIYDWTYQDVWKAIHDNGWSYCKLYDYQYQHGVSLVNMRVSNVHHETALKNLHYMQVVEPDTWNRITGRLTGINTIGVMQNDFERPPKQLPYMFASWEEYRDHLLDNLILDDDDRATFRKQFEQFHRAFIPEVHPELVKTEIACILKNDYHLTRLLNFQAAHVKDRVGRGRNIDEFTVVDSKSL